jgi:integrase
MPAQTFTRSGIQINPNSDIVIQRILRHEDVSTTQRSYIKTVAEVVTAATKRLQAEIACTALVQQERSSGLVN